MFDELHNNSSNYSEPSSKKRKIGENEFARFQEPVTVYNRSQTTIIFDIPDDQIQQIFSYFVLPDLSCLSLVSKHMKSLVESSHTFDMSFDNNEYFIPRSSTLSKLNSIFGRFNHLRKLRLHKLEQVSDFIFPVLNDCSTAKTLTHIELFDCILREPKSHNLNLGRNNILQHLTIRGSGWFHQDFLYSICTSHNLKVLKLSDYYHSGRIADDHVNIIMENLSGSLIDLHITHSNLSRPTIQSDNLTKLELGYCIEALPSIKCPSLKYLDLSSCHLLKDEALDEIITNCPKITHLHLKRCIRLHNPCFAKCQYLQKLNLNDCRGLLSLNIKSETLTEIFLGNCRTKKFPPSLHCLLSLHCPMLQCLHFSCPASFKNRDLKDLITNCPNLKELYLCNLWILNDDHINFIMQNLLSTLVNLHISGSNYITRPTIQSKIISEISLERCKKLKSIPIIKCPRLQYLKLNCSSLENRTIDEVLTNCPQLTSLQIIYYGHMGFGRLFQPCFDKCENLQKLVIKNFDINELKVSCTNLEILKIIDCSINQVFKLDTPKLIYVELLQCFVANCAVIDVTCPEVPNTNIHGSNLDCTLFCG